ncbi:MAG: CDP-glucose 4,6-dehydratase [Pseudomonadota bacterium]
MESLGITQFGGIYRGQRVLVTGHTGFKGSWLTLWLQSLGAQCTGLALAPDTSPNHWDLLGLDIPEWRLDLRDADRVVEAVRATAPDVVFHLAAQPLVRRAYRNPLETWSTNVMGTVNLLEACRSVPSVRAILVITSDKCYENREWAWGYRENDRLGGYDPYSASKAAVEGVVASYRQSFFNHPGAPLLASARAGNVIGGGDWSEDRLIPDLVRAVQQDVSIVIRHPAATRPWQHVLDCLSGYLVLGQRLLAGDQHLAEAWNFGPHSQDNRTVSEMLTVLRRHWPGFEWHRDPIPQPHEANLLYLDSTKAHKTLDWRPVWGLEQAVAMTAQWYRHQMEENILVSQPQLAEYVSMAQEAGLGWVEPSLKGK